MNGTHGRTFTAPVIILLVMGSIFLLLGIVPCCMWQANQRLLKTGIKTEGVIIDIVASGSSKSKSYTPVIKYKDRENTGYSFNSSFYSSGMHIGDSVDVYYDKDQPGKAALLMPDYFVAIFFIFPLIGALLLFLGIRFLMKNRKTVKLKTYLLQYGRAVIADITEIYQNTGLKVNGRSPYIVECCYTDSRGEKYLYKSENLYYNPLPYIENNTVKVYLHPQDENTYYIAIQETSRRVHDLR